MEAQILQRFTSVISHLFLVCLLKKKLHNYCQSITFLEKADWSENNNKNFMKLNSPGRLHVSKVL
jgi:hypothetical protein